MEEEVRSAGNLGYIGVIIELAGLIIGGIATLVGYIMELVALKRLAEALNRHVIWDNALKAVVVAVVGTITLIVLFLRPPLWAYVLSTSLHLLVVALL